MSSVPARQRGAASGMRATFQNTGTAVSIGAFFSLMIAGLAGALPTTLTSGLRQQGVSGPIAEQVGALPPVSSLFAAASLLRGGPTIGSDGRVERTPAPTVAAPDSGVA